MEEDKKILNFMQYLQSFEKMQIELINQSFNSLKDKFKSVEILKKFVTNKKEELDEDDKTEEFLAGFYDHACKTIKFVEEKIGNIEVQYEGVSKYLALQKMDLDNSWRSNWTCYYSFNSVFKSILFHFLSFYHHLKRLHQNLL